MGKGVGGRNPLITSRPTEFPPSSNLTLRESSREGSALPRHGDTETLPNKWVKEGHATLVSWLDSKAACLL